MTCGDRARNSGSVILKSARSGRRISRPPKADISLDSPSMWLLHRRLDAWPKSLASAFQTEAFREVLRANRGAQDDKLESIDTLPQQFHFGTRTRLMTRHFEASGVHVSSKPCFYSYQLLPCNPRAKHPRIRVGFCFCCCGSLVAGSWQLVASYSHSICCSIARSVGLCSDTVGKYEPTDSLTHQSPVFFRTCGEEKRY